jgi:DNA-binding winged helix-turn-helix (wHTH) protein/tetratricopeptide (TPR) repeat protein
MEAAPQTRKTRFGPFEVDFRSGEIHKHGIRLKLQDQPFQVLALLLEHSGDVVTRDELRQKLWPGDTFVDFDTGLNSAIKKLRDVLSDSADEPRYIETLPRRGYRFIASVENGPRPASAPIELRVVPAPVPTLQKPRAPWYKRRIVVAAGIAAFLVVAAFAAWRVFFSRPVLTEADVILLASFVNKTGDPIFDNSLDKALEVKLAESPFLSLFSEGNVHETLRMMRRDPNERVTPELGIEICKRQGLKALVVPEIAAVGNTYLITLDAIDARNQKSIARHQEIAESKDKVVAALGKAGSQLRRQLGESLSSVEKYNAPLDLATTSSLEALQAYRAALIPYRSGKTREAIPLFERAVELDPKFCSAYDMLGGAYHGIGDEQASRKNFARAFELKDDRVTQEENFLITATYYWNITGNLDKEYAVLVLYQQAYPRSVNAANLLGINYSQRNKKEEALKEFTWAIEHSQVPAVYAYSNASQMLMNLGRFDDAKKLLEQWQQKGTLFSYQIDMLYRIAFFQNDTATMERLTREAQADDLGWIGLQMQFAFLRGELGKFRSQSETVVNTLTRESQLENAADELAAHGQLESFLGNYALARSLCRHSGEGDNDSATELWRCAEAFADAGDLTRAEALAAKLDRMAPEDTIQQNVFLPLIHSIVERQRGNPAKAVDLLARAEPYDSSLDINYQRAQAYLAAGDSAKAVVELQKLLDKRGAGWWQVYAPLAQLGIARAYVMQGNREESRKAYDAFFTTWKNADSDIPILRQAKSEYKKLTTTASAAAAASMKKQ